MSLKVSVIKRTNKLSNLDIVQAQLVGLNKMTFEEWCDYLALDSTLNSYEVGAVLQLLCKKLPGILSTNSYIEWNNNGGLIKPTVSGSITEKEWKALLLASGKTEDECSSLTTACLKTSDLTAGISITLGSKVELSFQPSFTRVKSGSSGSTEEEESTDSEDFSGDLQKQEVE